MGASFCKIILDKFRVVNMVIIEVISLDLFGKSLY